MNALNKRGKIKWDAKVYMQLAREWRHSYTEKIMGEGEDRKLDKSNWLNIFRSRNNGWQAMMSADEQKKLEALPNKVTIYRGVIEGGDYLGLSWTLDKQIGMRFATQKIYSEYLRTGRNVRGMIITATVDKSMILKFWDRKVKWQKDEISELEIILDIEEFAKTHPDILAERFELTDPQIEEAVGKTIQPTEGIL